MISKEDFAVRIKALPEAQQKGLQLYFLQKLLIRKDHRMWLQENPPPQNTALYLFISAVKLRDPHATPHEKLLAHARRRRVLRLRRSWYKNMRLNSPFGEFLEEFGRPPVRPAKKEIQEMMDDGFSEEEAWAMLMHYRTAKILLCEKYPRHIFHKGRALQELYNLIVNAES